MINQELKATAQESQTPDLSVLLEKFEKLNMEILELSNEIAYRLNVIKTFPVENLTAIEVKEETPEDFLSHLNYQLEHLKSSKYRLLNIFNHIKTIV